MEQLLELDKELQAWQKRNGYFFEVSKDEEIDSIINNLRHTVHMSRRWLQKEIVHIECENMYA